MSAGWKYDWRWAISLFMVSFAVTLVVYLPTVQYLTGVWGDFAVGEYAHGYLVLAIAVYLVVINRERLAVRPPCPDARILPLLALAVFFWLLSALVDVQVAQALGLWSVVFALVWVLFGTRAALLLFFPLLYILFALPIWFPLSQLLQDMTADAVFFVTRLIQIPAYRHENLIVLSSGTLSIEEACSGLRYLMAALTLSTLYAYLNYQHILSRVTVVVTAALAAILSNFVRVFVVVYLGYKTDMQHPLVYDHLMLGWYLFGGVVVILLFIDNRVARMLNLEEKPEQPKRDDSTGIRPCAKGVAPVFVIWMCSVMLLVAGPLLLRMSVATQDSQSVTSAGVADGGIINTIVLPEKIGGWSRIPTEDDGWFPVYHGAMEAKYSYRKEGRQVTVFVGYYKNQHQGDEMVNDLNRIANKKVWRPQYVRDRLQHRQGYTVREQLLARTNSQNKLVWYRYNVSGKDTVNKYEAKLLQALGVFTGNAQAYVVAASTYSGSDTGEARKLLADFFADMKMFMNNDGRFIQSVASKVEVVTGEAATE